MSEFKVGDVVRLKSGGPPMTVRDTAAGQIICQWYDFTGGKTVEGTFGELTLVPYPPDAVSELDRRKAVEDAAKKGFDTIKGD